MKQLKKTLLAAALLLMLALCGAYGAAAQDLGLGSISSFTIEQTYVNVPQMDVFVYALDGEGKSLSPTLVSAAGVQLELGSKKLPTGTITMADEQICYVFLLDNSQYVSAEELQAYKNAILRVGRTKEPKDQVMVYTTAGGVWCACPPTTSLAQLYTFLHTVEPGDGEGDLTAAVAKIAEDINTDFASLAPRKALFACTSTLALLRSPAALAAVMSSEVSSQLNMALFTFAATEKGSELDLLSTMTNGKLAPCDAAEIPAAVAAKQAMLANALEIKTNVSAEDGGQKLETLTLSVPSLGSAVQVSTQIYMGHVLAQPAVERVEVTDRTHLTVTFNQAVDNADTPRNYRVRSVDVWGWPVPVKAVELSEDGRTAVLTTGPLYEGSYQVQLRKVTSRVTAANTCGNTGTLFGVEEWPRDQAFYLARFRTPALVLLAGLLLLALSGLLQKRHDRAAEAAAEAEALLASADESGADALPKRWLTMYVRARGAVADKRLSTMVESSLIIGSDQTVCDLCIPDARIRPQHCVLSVEGENVYVQPLEKCTVLCNKEHIVDRHRLKNEDVLALGSTRIQLVL